MFIVGLAEIHADDYGKFVEEAQKANLLFNQTYHVVEGEVMKSGYSFAKSWRSEENDQIIFEYSTVGDERVRRNHSALQP